MSVHVCECEHNGRTEYHLRYPGMTQAEAQNWADKINGGSPYDAPAPAQEVGLTEAERVRCLIASGCIGTVKMTYDSGPYEITRTSINASRLIDAIIAAIRAKGAV